MLEGEFIDDVVGGAGSDTLDLSDMDGTGGPGGTSGAAIINLATGTWDLTTGSGGARTIAGIEVVRGTQLGDVITGGAALEHLFGNGGADTLSGVGPGADRLWGGLGNDTYIIEAGDQVHELAGEGIDTVQSSITYTLASSVENLILTGLANLSATGNGLVNVISGNAGNNFINVNGGGADTAAGSLGDDLYRVDGRRYGDRECRWRHGHRAVDPELYIGRQCRAASSSKAWATPSAPATRWTTG